MRLTCSIDIGLIYNYPIDINPPTQAVRELENEVFLFVSLYEAEVKYAILVEE